MKKLQSIATIALLLIVGVTYSFAQTGKKEITKTETVSYTCPMHPKEMSSKKGECSKCGMELVKTLRHDTSGKGKKTAVVTKYVCKMDGQTSDKPGECPKCGMKMVSQENPTYSCPMHPKEMSDKSGKCPKCGMQMTPKESDKKEENHQH